MSTKTVKPLNSEAFDYRELCSVHAQQGCFSLAEYTAHTRTQGYRSTGRKKPEQATGCQVSYRLHISAWMEDLIDLTPL